MTIVPRTVTYGVNAIVTGGSQAVSGLSMLNPQRWAGANGRDQSIKRDEGHEQKGTVGVQTVMHEKAETTLQIPSMADSPRSPSSTAIAVPGNESFDRLELLVSLDTALELIQTDRDSLKRAETFARYPGKYGHKVREAIEEVFILMLKAAGDRHIAPGFRM